MGGQDWIGPINSKIFAVQDWIGFNVLDQDWTQSEKFHSPLIPGGLSFG